MKSYIMISLMLSSCHDNKGPSDKCRRFRWVKTEKWVKTQHYVYDLEVQYM